MLDWWSWTARPMRRRCICHTRRQWWCWCGRWCLWGLGRLGDRLGKWRGWSLQGLLIVNWTVYGWVRMELTYLADVYLQLVLLRWRGRGRWERRWSDGIAFFRCIEDLLVEYKNNIFVKMRSFCNCFDCSMLMILQTSRYNLSLFIYAFHPNNLRAFPIPFLDLVKGLLWLHDQRLVQPYCRTNYLIFDAQLVFQHWFAEPRDFMVLCSRSAALLFSSCIASDSRSLFSRWCSDFAVLRTWPSVVLIPPWKKHVFSEIWLSAMHRIIYPKAKNPQRRSLSVLNCNDEILQGQEMEVSRQNSLVPSYYGIALLYFCGSEQHPFVNLTWRLCIAQSAMVTCRKQSLI